MHLKRIADTAKNLYFAVRFFRRGRHHKPILMGTLEPKQTVYATTSHPYPELDRSSIVYDPGIPVKNTCFHRGFGGKQCLNEALIVVTIPNVGENVEKETCPAHIMEALAGQISLTERGQVFVRYVSLDATPGELNEVIKETAIKEVLSDEPE